MKLKGFILLIIIRVKINNSLSRCLMNYLSKRNQVSLKIGINNIYFLSILICYFPYILFRKESSLSDRNSYDWC